MMMTAGLRRDVEFTRAPRRVSTGRTAARTRSVRSFLAAIVVFGLCLGLGACGQSEPRVPGALSGTIAFLLPESKTARYESIDRPHFIKVVKQRCPDCTLLYANADQDPARQQSQAEAALTQGARVLVLDAVDASAANSIISAAHSRGVAVVAYDRFLAGADYYVSFDSERVGRMQGEALVNHFKEQGIVEPGLLVVNGSPTDSNSAALRRGLQTALAGTDVRILAEYDTPDWSPDKAQDWVGGQLTQFAGQIDAVYAANDGTAGGAISAMRAAGTHPVPPVTGQDAELVAVQRIVAGDQFMTVFKAFSQQARTAAELAVRLLDGQTPAATARLDGIPAMLLAPVVVNRESIRTVLVSGGVFTIPQICAEPFAQACVAADLVVEQKD